MSGIISRGGGAVSRARGFPGIAMLLSFTVLLAGCDRDAPTASLRVSDSAGPVSDTWSNALPADDPGIDPNDTNVLQTQTVAETTTVTSTEAFADPNTGQQVYTATVGSPPQSLNVSAGYGYDGQPRITTGFEQTNSEETVWLRRVTDETTDRRADGSDTQGFAYDPMNEVGTLVGAQLYGSGGSGGGGGGDSPCTITVACPASTSPSTTEPAAIRPFGPYGPAIAATRGAHGARVTMLPHDRIRVEEYLTEPPTHGAGLMNLSVSAAVSQPPADAAEVKMDHKITRDYEQQDDEWLLKHTLNETFVDAAGSRARHALHLTVVKRTLHRNKQKDAERAKSVKPSAVGLSPTADAHSLHIQDPTCDPTTAVIPCLVEYSNVESAPDETTVGGGDFMRVVRSTGPALVLQHGFFSDAKTWKRMDGWLGQDVAVGSVYRLTLPWSWKYEDEAGVLRAKIGTATASSGAILVGHSNGGMVVRYLARHPLTGADASVPKANIKAVITVGTPHWGAPIARYGASINRLFGWGGLRPLLACAIPLAGCSAFHLLTASSLVNVFTPFASNIPVLDEMQPNDRYHSAFNSETEGFRRFGISSQLGPRWLPWRIWGDAYCFPESGCGGGGQVRRIDRIYKRDIACVIMGSIFGRWDAAARCAFDASFVRGFERMFGMLSEVSGDGIVPAWSQTYPHIVSDDQYLVNNGPSHLGETKSARIGNRIERILVGKLGLGGKVVLAP
jgi:pimeloyl-ACP methyl ester carboxylesterase